MVSNASICLDTNLLIDVLGDRNRAQKVREIISANYVCVNTHSIATAYYHAKKYSGFDNLSYQKFIDQFKILLIDAEIINKSFEFAGEYNDLEDAIQITACKHAGVDIFVTADKKLAELYCDELNIELVE